MIPIAMLVSLLIVTNLIWFVHYKRLNEDWLKLFLQKESELSATRNNLMRAEIENRGFVMKGADDNDYNSK
jgi:hypothetical protein